MTLPHQYKVVGKNSEPYSVIHHHPKTNFLNCIEAPLFN